MVTLNLEEHEFETKDELISVLNQISQCIEDGYYSGYTNECIHWYIEVDKESEED